MGYKRVSSILNKEQEKQFQEWMEDGNVIEFEDGYSTQDAQYRNRLKDLDALRLYFYNEFIKGQYAVGGNVLLAPNGKPSKLTPEQYKLVRTPAFKKWFGDWESLPETASKVVDENGEPMVCYHGTYIRNKKINGTYTELNTSTYFTDQKLTAEKYPIGDYVFYNSMNDLEDDLGDDYTDYINDNFDIDESKGIMFSAEAENVWENFEFENIHIYECFLDIKNPKMYYHFSENEFEFQDLHKDSPIINQFKNEGYDGLIKIYEARWFTKDWFDLNKGKKSDYKKEKHFVIFNPNQIKLADGTNTTFEDNNPDIRYAGGGRTMVNRAKKQARKDIKTHLYRPHFPYESMIKPSEEWERYELPYDTKIQYDFEPDSFSAQGKRYSEYATGGKVGDLIKFKNLDKEVLVGRINNVLGENRYSVSSGFGSFLVDKSNYVGEVETPAPRKKFLGIFADGGEAGFDDAGCSMVIYHEKKGNFMIPKGQIYLYLYDVEISGEKLQNGEFDWVFYPYSSISLASQSGYIPPLKRVWTKKFQKEHKGSEHLLGLIKAYLIEKEGKKELFIDMMSVNPNNKKEGIMSYMIKDLRDSFNLSQDQVTFSDLTDEGKKFVVKKTYADGGGVSVLSQQDEIELNDFWEDMVDGEFNIKQHKEDFISSAKEKFTNISEENLEKLFYRFFDGDLALDVEIKSKNLEGIIMDKFTFDDAKRLANDKKKYGWRLPNLSEIQEINYYGIDNKIIGNDKTIISGSYWINISYSDLENIKKNSQFVGVGINEDMLRNSYIKYRDSLDENVESNFAWSLLLSPSYYYEPSLTKKSSELRVLLVKDKKLKEDDNKYADGGDTEENEYRRGGFMYEVQKKGSPSNDMRETMFTAKNLTELKKKIIEKYGTSEGFLVSRRTEQGYYAPVKFEDGGAIYPDLSLQKAQVVNDSVQLAEFQIKKSKNIFKISGIENLKVTDSDKVVNILRSLFEKDTISAYEQSFILYLNSNNNIIGYYHHSSGGIDGTVMDIQMISGLAVKSLAKGVIVSHNHPSENTKPSDADKRITKQLDEALKLFNIKLLDSIILTENSYLSFRDAGILV